MPAHGQGFSVAPYGQDDLGDLRSIFEMLHLRRDALFLNTQCSFPSFLLVFLMITSFLDRMPVPIGGFISGHVYDSKLLTRHEIKTWRCCRFVDCKTGEEKKVGYSWSVCIRSGCPHNLVLTCLWQNLKEAQVAVAIARRCAAKGRSFRIITPYDAQRSMIEKSLKVEKLPWENKCFNVDAFQGIVLQQ
jgi:AAA domain